MLSTQNSLFWHEFTPDGSFVATWQNVLADRSENSPFSVQAELNSNGEAIFRYDIPDGTTISNFVIGVQNASDGIAALLGNSCDGNTHTCATIYEYINGAIESTPLCTIISPGGILSGPKRFELRWKNLEWQCSTFGDVDGDALSDYEEVLIYHTNPEMIDSDLDGKDDCFEVFDGTNPTDCDTDHDGIADGWDEYPLIPTTTPVFGQSSLWQYTALTASQYAQVTNSASYAHWAQSAEDTEYTLTITPIGAAIANPIAVAVSGYPTVIANSENPLYYRLNIGQKYEIRISRNAEYVDIISSSDSTLINTTISTLSFAVPFGIDGRFQLEALSGTNKVEVYAPDNSRRGDPLPLVGTVSISKYEYSLEVGTNRIFSLRHNERIINHGKLDIQGE